MTSSHPPALAFYIHHHGSGHLMRALTIAGMFPERKIIFMGTGLEKFAAIIPARVQCIHLPADLAQGDEAPVEEKLRFLHYAPVGVSGIRDRMAAIAAVFAGERPALLVVDVSVEICLFARLCSIPTLVIRQHGHRSDPAHLAAYESAALLVAPFSAAMAPPGEEAWVRAKTVFVGGFSRYTAQSGMVASAEETHAVAVLVGEGGSSLDRHFVEHLAAAAPEFTFHVAGPVQPESTIEASNIIWHGKLPDPEVLLRRCALVIGNAGHNTVMEMADLNKRFICIPEPRPFEEQLMKAELLDQGHHARVIQPADTFSVNWREELEAQLQIPAQWAGVTNTAALEELRNAILEIIGH